MRYIIGTRGSALALAQSEQVRTLLQNTYPQHSFTLQIIATKGDLQQHVALDQMDAKGIFVKEIEEALLAGKIHMAGHSLKDYVLLKRFFAKMHEMFLYPVPRQRFMN